MSLESYRLPQHASDVPDLIRALYQTSGFPKEVRDWHLARLPRYVIPSGTYIRCPYCGKLKDRRSMQRDHIIPARMYVRYRLYQQRAFLTPMTIIGHAQSAYNDRKNLLLACMRCNSGKRDRCLTIEQYNDAILRTASMPDFQNRLVASWATLQEIRALPKGQPVAPGPIRHSFKKMKDKDIDVHGFVCHGATWSTRSIDVSPLGTPETLQGELSQIHKAIIETLEGGSRPAWTVSIRELEAAQPTQNFQHQEGRLCLYCMGLFKKQAFQLDHMNPASGRSEASYNDPTNLIPVCRTCNTAKGNMRLTTEWLDSQIRRRVDEGLPGIELVAFIPGADAGEKLEWAKLRRIDALGR